MKFYKNEKGETQIETTVGGVLVALWLFIMGTAVLINLLIWAYR